MCCSVLVCRPSRNSAGSRGGQRERSSERTAPGPPRASTRPPERHRRPTNQQNNGAATVHRDQRVSQRAQPRMPTPRREPAHRGFRQLDSISAAADPPEAKDRVTLQTVGSRRARACRVIPATKPHWQNRIRHTSRPPSNFSTASSRDLLSIGCAGTDIACAA